MRYREVMSPVVCKKSYSNVYINRELQVYGIP
jgi:hypothetical protein